MPQPLQSLWRAGCDFLYPPACVFCAAPLSSTKSEQSAVRFCPECRKQLLPDDSPSCRRCAAPVGPHLNTADGCLHCRDDSFAFESVIRLGVYESLLRRVCTRMKHREATPLAFASADLLWKLRAEELRAVDANAVVAVPRHWTRNWSADHHSAESLGRRIAKHLGVPFRLDILRMVRRTPRQASLKPTQRRGNLRGAFTAEMTDELQRSTLLLVDDVFTTGTTANQVSRALRKAGAGKVVVAVLARGLGRT